MKFGGCGSDSKDFGVFQYACVVFLASSSQLGVRFLSTSENGSKDFCIFLSFFKDKEIIHCVIDPDSNTVQVQNLLMG